MMLIVRSRKSNVHYLKQLYLVRPKLLYALDSSTTSNFIDRISLCMHAI